MDDLVDFDKDTIIEQIAANLRRPAGRVPDPNPATAAGHPQGDRLPNLARSY